MFYDFISDKYRNNKVTKIGTWNVSQYHQKICRTMHTLQAQGLVLEIGPGRELFAEECVSMCYEYVGIECNQRLLHKQALKFQVISGLVPPLPVKNESFHVIVADQIVEHMPSFREAFSLLSECFRSLKPGGLLVLGFPDYARMPGLAFYDDDYSHSFVTSENRMNLILRDVGFQPLKVLRFRGSITNPFMRVLLDLVMLSIYARVTCLIASAFGGREFLYKCRKTFVASTIIFARKSTVLENGPVAQP